jgi:hypothetical protein
MRDVRLSVPGVRLFGGPVVIISTEQRYAVGARGEGLFTIYPDGSSSEKIPFLVLREATLQEWNDEWFADFGHYPSDPFPFFYDVSVD